MTTGQGNNIRMTLAFAFASVFTAWAAYLIHVIPIEGPSLPILEALIDFSGRAPDQYRVVPYILIGLVQDVLNTLPGIEVGLRYPIVIFDSVFLFLSATALRSHFENIGGGESPGFFS